MKKRFFTVLTALAMVFAASFSTGAVSQVRITSLEESYTEYDHTMTAKYPQISGMDNTDAQEKINAMLRDQANSTIAKARFNARESGCGLKGEVFYNVGRNDDGIVSILMTKRIGIQEVDYLEYKDGLTFNATSGQIYRLRDLFNTDADYVTAISDAVSRQITEQGLDNSQIRPFRKIDRNQDFYLTDDSLVVMVTENSFFTNDEGAVEFSVPLSTLRPMFREDIASALF